MFPSIRCLLLKKLLLLVFVDSGISASKLGKVDSSFRLSLLGFDACLMGSYDVLETLAPLTHFFLASEENEPGHGWNYRQVQQTNSNPSTISLWFLY